MSQQDILSPETVAKIQKTNPELLSPESNGQRKVSWDLLSPSTSPSSGSSTNSWASRAASESPTAQRSLRPSSTSSVSIPTQIDSVQTYEFMGFTKDRAERLLAWQKPHHEPRDVAHDWVFLSCLDIDDATDNWGDVMQSIGIKDQVRLPMLKPEHQKILSTQSLAGWLIEIIDTFYNFLEDLEANLLLKLSGTPCLRGGGGQELEYTVPQMPGGHLAVFKSVDGKHIKRCIQADGTFELSLLESIACTDFTHRGGLYFTHQLWVARAYSKLISDSCSVADRRTLELHVPLSHLKEIKTWELPYGDEWKQIIWYSRRGYLLPKPLLSHRAQYGCIQGPIAHSHSKTIAKLSSWENVELKHVMTDEVVEDGKTQTRTAVQLVWMEPLAIHALQDATLGKAYVRLPEQGFRLVEDPCDDLKHLE
ncbi:hypothetical protein GMOD_00004489 [Pyrenophora seminiperda CCB06]|uniref:Uncharacterized protein n=1 Tax=Pyrenophora seminiperda CCB06 TaxID=1302712 RepID=A0A3M7M1I5_9PLEO|nr:hypothetical protein GMOD_00004489 [Pyrenophora seminiperda CCB06]